MALDCASCRRGVGREGIFVHFEEFHTGPRPVEILQLDCQDCKFRVSAEKPQFMINHCISENHKYRGISEWRKFMQTEGERVDRLIQLGIETLVKSEPENQVFDESYAESVRQCGFPPKFPEFQSPSKAVLEDGKKRSRSNIQRFAQNSQSPASVVDSSDPSGIDAFLQQGRIKEDPDPSFGGLLQVEGPNPVVEYARRKPDATSSNLKQPRSSEKMKRKSTRSESSKPKKSRRSKADSLQSKLHPIGKQHMEIAMEEQEGSLKQDYDEPDESSEVDPNFSQDLKYTPSQHSTRRRSYVTTDAGREFFCRICGHILTSKSKFMCDLVRHLGIHDYRLRKYECVTCLKRFDYESVTVMHLKNNDGNRQCQDYRFVNMTRSERLKVVEEMMAQAFPDIEIPENYKNLRKDKSELEEDGCRETCAVCQKNMRVTTTAAAVYHAMRHDKNLGWYDCACCHMKFDNLSGVHRHAGSKSNDCTGEANELIGPEMVEKVQVIVDKCFPEGNWNVWNMRQLQKMELRR